MMAAGSPSGIVALGYRRSLIELRNNLGSLPGHLMFPVIAVVTISIVRHSDALAGRGGSFGNYALIGMGSGVMDDALVGEGAIVAAGSVVLAKTVIEPYSLWAGVPAKFIKKVSPEQSKELNERIANNYQMYASWFDKEQNP